MGCSSSVKVQPFTPGQVKVDEDETGSKHSGRGDSAVSKGTTDSGVVLENRDASVLPGAIPRKPPPLTSVGAAESGVEKTLQHGVLQDNSTQERLKSSDILKELLHQGIIPVTEVRESRTGGSYSIMLNDSEEVLRRPPPRLESLKGMKRKETSREESEEKMRLAEERRKLKEDELKRRLRAKSARAGHRQTFASSTEEDGDTTVTAVKSLQSSPIPEPSPTSQNNLSDPAPHSLVTHDTAAEGREGSRRPGGDKVGGNKELNTSGEKRAVESVTETTEQDKKEETTQVQELKEDKLLTDSPELENDSTFQHPLDDDETF
ncbi:stathmin domain-containing protein 1 [Sphaeramia orbicularis]|uniref:stathmin domain-containing protein 1 n=1 Tax=Sphaeramia orbicularis TaxID=375764 RepID=UPI00117CC7CA|nr:stathmin domain-containing protein 1 [Sphaeramia orbicularis]